MMAGSGTGGVRARVCTLSERRWVVVVWLLAAAASGPVQAALTSANLSMTAASVAQRQESNLPWVDPSPVTVTVSNTGTTTLRVDAASLTFGCGARSASSQYAVTGPVLPVTVQPSSSTALTFQVRPLASATVFETVNVTATVSATDLESSVPSTAVKATAWTVTPGAKRVLGQGDAYSWWALQHNLTSPSKLWTDGTRVVVADMDSNRVLIWNSYPTTSYQAPDLVLGQPDLMSKSVNTGGVSARSLNRPMGVASDGTRLLVCDTTNSRALLWNSFPTASGTPADVVLGQPDMTSLGANNGGVSANSLNVPFGGTLSGGRIFIADTYNRRLLIWNSIPSDNGAPAELVLGQSGFTTNGSGVSDRAFSGPTDVALNGSRIYMTDFYSRVLVWTSLPVASDTPANLVLGQSSFTGWFSNSPSLSETSLYDPFAVACSGAKVFVADRRNHRALLWNSLPTSNAAPADRVLGQTSMTIGDENSGGLSARSLNFPMGVALSAAGLAVSDTLNNRVMLWNSLSVTNGAPADVVLGQTDFVSTRGHSGGTSARGLGEPEAVAAAGNRVTCAIPGQNRVLIWTNLPGGSDPAAELVLGQPDMLTDTANNGGISAGSLNGPRGVATDGTRLVVADTANKRVLIWNSFPLTDTAPADRVLGQPDMLTGTANNGGISAASLNGPRGVAIDGTRLVVADTGNNRVLIWSSFPQTDAAPANLVLGQPNMLTSTANGGGCSAKTLNQPCGVAIDGTRLAVADGFNERILVWNSFPLTSTVPADRVVLQYTMQQAGYRGAYSQTVGVALDGDRLYATDGQNRMLVWSPMPTADGANPTGLFGQSSMTGYKPAETASPWMASARGLAVTSEGIWLTDSTVSRLLYLDTRHAFSASLEFNRPGRVYGAGTLAVTATFTSPPADTPRLTIDGGAAGASANDEAAAPMIASNDPQVWTYGRTLSETDEGVFVVTLIATDTTGWAVQPPANNSFTVDATRPAVALAYSRDRTAVGLGPLTITATFGEPLVTTPTLLLDAPGVSNDTGPAAMAASADLAVWRAQATINGGADTDGAASVTIANGLDAAGNANQPATNATFTVDTHSPTVTLTYDRPERLYRAQTFVVTATFSEAISPSAPTLDIGGTTGGVTVSGATMAQGADRTVWTWQTDLRTGDTQGAHMLTLAASDAAGNALAVQPAGNSFTLDTVAPSVQALAYSRTLEQLPAGPLTVTADFTEPLATALTPTLLFSPAGNFVPASPAPERLSPTRFVYATQAGGGTSPAGDAFTLTVDRSTVADPAGNTASADRSAGGTVDTSAPAVTLSYNRPERLYRAQTFIVTATFSEAISPSAPTLDIGGTTGGGTVSGATMTPGADRTVWTWGTTLLTDDTQGEHSVTLAAADAAGNALAAQAAAGSFVVDTAPPALQPLTFSRAADRLKAGPLTVTADFTEPLAADVTPALSFSPAGNFTPALPPATRVSPTRFVYDASVVGGTSPSGDAYTATVDRNTVVDPAGNSPAADHVSGGLVDTCAPTATLVYNRPSRLYRAEPFSITVTFSEEITPAAPTLSLSGTTNGGTVTDATMTQGADRTVWSYQTTVQTTDTQGARTLDLEARDAASNALASQPAGNTFVVSTAGLLATLTYSNASRLYRAGPFTVTASFTEEVTPDAPALTVTGTTGGLAVSNVPMTQGADRTVWTWLTALQPDDTQGTHALTLGAVSAAGDGLAAQPLDSSFRVDTVPPELLSMVFSRAAGYLRPGPLLVTADFTEALETGTAPKLTFVPSGNFSPAVPLPARISPTRYGFSTTVGGSTPEGGVPYTATVDRTTVVDLAGNQQSADGTTSGTADGNLPASLTIGAFSAPANVTRGQVFDASVVLTNPGGTTADIASSTLAFSDTGLTAVPSGLNPHSIAAGAGATFRYTVTAAGTAPATARAPRLTVLAKDHVEQTDVSLVNRALSPQVTVLRPAALSPGALVVPGAVSQGQVFGASVSVTNSGDAAAAIRSTSLVFGVSGLTAVPDEAYPVTLSGGVSATFHYTVTVLGTASTGEHAGSLTVSASDTISGAGVGLASQPLSPAVTVQTPAQLVLVSVETASTVVERGQRGLGVTVRARNPGQATATIGGLGLSFTAGTASRGSQFVVSPAPNPATVAGGTTAVFAFTVNVSPTATLGPVTLDATCDGSDVNSGSALADASADLTASWTVQSPVTFSTGPLAAPERISQGQTFGASVVVTNASTRTAVLTSTSLIFSNASLSAVPSGPYPRSLAGGVGTALAYTVTAEAAAATGACTASLTVLAKTTDTDADVSLLHRALTPHLTVQTPARLRVTAISPSAAEVFTGQTGLSVVVTVASTGDAVDGAGVSALSAALSFAGSGLGYRVTPLPGNATTLAAGASTRLTFAVEVLVSADAGPTPISAAVEGRDVNSGLPAAVDPPADTASWNVTPLPVLTLPALRWDQSAAGGSLRRGGTARLLATVANDGRVAATLTSRRLVFAAAGAEPGLTASETPGTATVVAAGQAVTLTFDVSAALTATELGVTREVLVVVDGQSTGATVRTSAVTQLRLANCPPTAVIAPALASTTRVRIFLDGRDSFDGPAASRSEGEPLTYSWMVETQPEGSALNAASFVPRGSAGWAAVDLTPTMPGDYRFGLTVNDGHDTSAQATVAVTVANMPPTARVSRTVISASPGSRVALDGSASSDGDGDALVYRWRIISVPAGSHLGGAGGVVPNDTATAARSVFVPDVCGTYGGTLSVFDGIDASALAFFTVEVPNASPVAVLRPALLGATNARCALDGSLSADADGTSLSYEWSFTRKPATSALTNESLLPNGSASAARTAFTPDVAGDYEVELTVRDDCFGEALARTAVKVLADGGVPSGQRIYSPLEGQTILRDDDLVWPGVQVLVSFRASSPTERVLVNGEVASRPLPSEPWWVAQHLVTLPLGRTSVLQLFDPKSPGRAPQPGLMVSVPAVIGPIPRADVDLASGGPRMLRLDGSHSTDVNPSVTLAYKWSLGKSPVATEPFISRLPATTFGLSGVGAYQFLLEVTASDGLTATAPAVAAVVDVPPVAAIAAPVTVILSRPDLLAPHAEATRTLRLDGRGSSDANGQRLSYLWEVVRAPDRSDAQAATTTAVTLRDAAQAIASAEFSTSTKGAGSPPPLVAAGGFGFRLTVSDGSHLVSATAAVVAIDPAEPLPNADPGANRRLAVTASGDAPRTGSTYPDPLEPSRLLPFVRLDGANSADSRGRTLTYAWTVTGKPAGSTLSRLENAPTAYPSFVPDKLGVYQLSLRVSNGLNGSEVRTVRVLVDDLTKPAPIAVAVAQQLGSGRRTSASTPILEVLTGQTVLLDGNGSRFAAADEDLTDPGNVVREARHTLEWTQLEGERVEPVPCAGANRKFTAVTPGLRRFQLTATSLARGLSDTARVAVMVRGVAPPVLTVETAATGTSRTGRELQNETPVAPTGSLKATLPTTIAMTARLVGSTAGQPYRFVWTQVDGPRVVLTRVTDEAVRTGLSVTQFTPTTSRLYEFTVAATRLDAWTLEEADQPVTRRVRVVVSQRNYQIPEPVPQASPSKLPVPWVVDPITDRVYPSGGTGEFFLDGSTSVTGVYPPSTRLAYQWNLEETGGFAVTIWEPHALRTKVTYSAHSPGCGAPSPQTKTALMFSLTIDVLPPGDRSEPVYVSVEQPGIDPSVIPPEAAGLRMFLDSVYPVSETTYGMLPTAFPKAVLPLEVTTGQVLTLETVDSQGRPLQPPFPPLRRNVLAFVAGGARSIESFKDGELLLDPAVKGAVGTAVFQPSRAMLESLGVTPSSALGGGAVRLAGGSAGGGTCALGTGHFGRWPDVLTILSPVLYLLLWRRRPRRKGPAA